MKRIICALLLLCAARPVAAQQPVSSGKPLFVSAATIACGPLEAKYPFDPSTYGTVRGYSPATTPDEKIVLFTRTLDTAFFQLASAVDTIVAENPGLAGSLVIVLDEPGAQRGGYSLDALQARRTAIRTLAAQNRIKNLSFFISAPPASSSGPRLGLTGDNTALLVHLVPDAAHPKGHAVVRWFTRLPTARLDSNARADAVAALTRSISGR